MDKIVVLDFGGQYAHLIANRIRRLNVYSEIKDASTKAEDLLEYKGIILSGGPLSVFEENAPKFDSEIFDLGVPILGICYGHQLLMQTLGGKVEKGKIKEYGLAELEIEDQKSIFKNLQDRPNLSSQLLGRIIENVWMSHGDEVTELPIGFETLASTNDCKNAAVWNPEKKIVGIQFHPEVTHTDKGMQMLDNFINICECSRDWNLEHFFREKVNEIKEKVGNKKVFLLISGGIDSTVTYLLLAEALGAHNVYGLLVDTGFLRKNEREEIEITLRKLGVNLHVHDGKEEYFEALDKVYNPEEKRKIIGDLFVKILEKETNKLNITSGDWMFAQGTIYPDTIESGGTKHSDKIKTHHNRVEKIQELIDEGRLIEPIAELYKDEVRDVAAQMGLDEKLVWRHPFPGPGLAIRIICSEKEFFPDRAFELEHRINLLLQPKRLKAKIFPIRSVGVQGDARSYKNPVAVHGIAEFAQLEKVGTDLINKYPILNRAIYCVSDSEIINYGLTEGLKLTPNRVELLQKADEIVRKAIEENNLTRKIWQFPVVLIPININGRKGESIVLRPVASEEAMTANFYKLPTDVLKSIVLDILSLDGISGVFYDITNKPPGTIEWE